MKKTAQAMLLLAIALYLFKGVLYRAFVSYEYLSERSYKPAGADLRMWVGVNVNLQPSDTTGEAILDIVTRLAARQLYFDAGKKVSADPNVLQRTKAANCIGYAAFTAACGQVLLEAHGLDKEWVLVPVIGRIYCAGINIHPYFSTPFFKDHDYVELVNRRNGIRLAADPSLFDYTGIRRIQVRPPVANRKQPVRTLSAPSH